MLYITSLVCGMFLVVVGLPLGLYALLTRNQRRCIRDIRQRVRQRGWAFRRRRWTGNPTSFRIEGETGSGIKWILTTTGADNNNRGWTVRLHQRFPSLAGATDVAIALRESKDERLIALASISPTIASKLTTLSGSMAGALEFLHEAREAPSGNAAFDAAYHVLTLPGQSKHPLVDSKLAEHIMDWPAESIAAHSMLVWRDPFAFHAEARLPGPPNWATIEHLLVISESLIERLPRGAEAVAPSGIIDRLVAGLVR